MMATDRQLGLLTVALISLSAAMAGTADAASGPRPDLGVKSLVAPASVTTGASFAVTDTVKNVGKAKARRSDVRFTLSLDQLADKNDIEVGTRTVKKLRPHRKSAATTTFTAPSAAGTFFVVACADALNAVRERREGNNCQASAQPLSVVAPPGQPEPDPTPTEPPPTDPGPAPTTPPAPLTWMLRNTNTSGNPDLTFEFGVAGDIPVVGDWDGNGIDTVGVFRPSTQTWLLRNFNSAGAANVSFAFGTSTSMPVAGDWDGNGTDTVGVYEPASGVWSLRNSLSAGGADLSFTFTNGSGTIPLTGDWDGNGNDTAGYADGSIRALRNFNSGGAPNLLFTFGGVSDKPVTGNWDGAAGDSQGFVQAAAPTHNLRNSNTTGAPDLSFSYALTTDTPIAGDWDGDNVDTVGAVR
jgi:hypothetical protein